MDAWTCLWHSSVHIWWRNAIADRSCCSLALAVQCFLYCWAFAILTRMCSPPYCLHYALYHFLDTSYSTKLDWVCNSKVKIIIETPLTNPYLFTGPIPYFSGSELFQVESRAAAMSMGSFSSWFFNFVVGMTFELLQRSIGAAVFLIFAAVCAFMAIFLNVYMPETRGRDTAEIAKKVSDGFRSRPMKFNGAAQQWRQSTIMIQNFIFF